MPLLFKSEDVRNEDEIVAHLVVNDLYSDIDTRIPIYSNDQFFLGRQPSTCRAAWDDPCISHKHLRIHCVVFDDSNETLPLVYLKDNSTNGTMLSTRHGAGNSQNADLIFLRKQSGPVLLHHGDEILLAGSVQLKFEELYVDGDENLESQVQRERRAFNESYVITNRKLGVGGQGSVHIAIDKATKRQLACKVVKLSKPLNDGADLRSGRLTQSEKKANHSVFREFNILKDISHPNIIAVEKVLWTSQRVYIFQELVTAGDLFAYIELRNGRVADPEACIIIYEILKAVEYLHHQGIVHRDLKPDNVLVTSLKAGARIVITDFGSARRLNTVKTYGKQAKSTMSRLFSIAGTTEFCAPEVHGANPIVSKSYGYGPAVDMWSVGCIMTALLSGDVLFVDRTRKAYGAKDVLDLAARCDLTILDTGAAWQSVGRRPKHLVRQLFQLDETKRLTATQALAHSWFTNKLCAASLQAVYAKAIADWQPKRKAFRMVDRLLTDDTQTSADDMVRSSYFESLKTIAGLSDGDAVGQVDMLDSGTSVLQPNHAASNQDSLDNLSIPAPPPLAQYTVDRIVPPEDDCTAMHNTTRITVQSERQHDFDAKQNSIAVPDSESCLVDMEMRDAPVNLSQFAQDAYAERLFVIPESQDAQCYHTKAGERIVGQENPRKHTLSQELDLRLNVGTKRARY